MSKLTDRINDLARPEAPAMGFRRAESEVKRLSLLVIVDMTGRPEAEIREIAGLGVSAAVISASGRGAAALARELKACNGMVIGLLVNGTKPVNGLKNSGDGIDFIICGTDMPLRLYAGKEFEKAGRVVRLETGLEPGRLRAVNGLYPAVDAVLVDLEAGALTVDGLLACRRVAEISGQPMIAALDKCPCEPELMSLREAGARGLLLPAGWPIDDIRECLEIVAALPRPLKKKDREKGTVSLLPHLAAAPRHEEEGEEDDD